MEKFVRSWKLTGHGRGERNNSEVCMFRFRVSLLSSWVLGLLGEEEGKKGKRKGVRESAKGDYRSWEHRRCLFNGVEDNDQSR